MSGSEISKDKRKGVRSLWRRHFSSQKNQSSSFLQPGVVSGPSHSSDSLTAENGHIIDTSLLSNHRLIQSISAPSSIHETKSTEPSTDSQPNDTSLNDSGTPAHGHTTQQEASLWDRAYDNLRASDQAKVKKLIKEYEALLREDLLSNIKDISTSQQPTSKASDDTDSLFDRTIRYAQLENELRQGKQLHEIKGKIIIRGHILDIQNYITNIASGLDFAKDWIGQAVKASPEASVVWAVICLGLQLFTKGAQVEETNKEGLAYVSSRMQLYIALEELLFPANGPTRSKAAREEICLSLIELYGRILDFQIRSILRFRRGHFYEDVFGKDNWQIMKSAIEALESNIQKDSLLVGITESSKHLRELLQNATETHQQMIEIHQKQLKVLQVMSSNADKQTDLQSQMLKQQEEVRQEKKEGECMEILRLDPRYEDFKDPIEARVEGTCHWFLGQPDYKTWLSKSGGCLLVTADPGCGKSVLTKYIYDHELRNTKDADRTTCYFFFKDQTQNTFAIALCALLHQLLKLEKNGGMFKYLLPLHKSDGSKMKDNHTGLSEALMKALADPKIQPVTFFLDALDECKRGDRQRLLAWIAQIGPSRHKFFLTSRPYGTILQDFKEVENLSYVEIPGNDSTNEISKEVNIVIGYRCEKLVKTGHIYEETGRKLQAKLLAQPNNTYLFVHLVFDLLAKQRQRRNMTADELEEVLENLPKDLDQAYEKILSRNTEGDERSSKIVSRILSVMLSAYRPLTIEEIQCVVKMKPDISISHHEELNLEDIQNFSEKLRDWCGLFVRVSDEGQVSFFHQTAREFLLSREETGDIGTTVALTTWAHSISLIYAHAILAKVCISYLTLQDFDQPDGTFSSVDGAPDSFGLPEHQVGEKETPTGNSKRYPLLDYAAKEWNNHFAEGHCDESMESMSRALALYSDKTSYFSTWTAVADTLPLRQMHYLPISFWEPRPLTVAAAMSPPLFRRLIDTPDSLSNAQLLEAALMIAIEKKHEENIRLLLEKGTNPNSKGRRGMTALFGCVSNSLKSTTTYLLELGAEIDTDALCQASLLDDTHFLEKFLEHNVDLNAMNSDGFTPLHVAARATRVKAVDLLLKHNARINTHSKDERKTAFYFAAAYGSLEIVQLLLERDIGHDINVNESNDQGFTPLISAAYWGHSAIVKCLLSWQAGVDKANDFGETALMDAASQGNYEIVDVLLEHHADVNLHALNGNTALHFAALAGHDRIVETLLQHHADTDLRNTVDKTALHSAALRGNDKTAEILLKHDAKLELEDEDGRTPLHIAAFEGHHMVMEVLLKHKANVNTRNKHGCCALLTSAQFGYLAGVEMLLQYGADPNIIDSDGDTAILSASMNAQQDIVRHLLQHNAIIAPQNFTGNTAMHLVAKGNLFEKDDNSVVDVTRIDVEIERCIKTMQILIDAGADINAANSDGLTPLMRAVSRLRSHRPILEYMINQRANVSVQDKNGCTPMHYIYSNDALQVLLEHGLDVNKTNNSGQTPLQHILLGLNGIKSYSRMKDLYQAMVHNGADLTIKDNQGFSPSKCLDGGFSFNSQHITIDEEANLRAICETDKLGTNLSAIDLNTCLKVEGGLLKWSEGGGFSGLAKEAKLLYGGRILQAQIPDGNDDGAWKMAYIWLDEKIANDDGNLKFLDQSEREDAKE